MTSEKRNSIFAYCAIGIVIIFGYLGYRLVNPQPLTRAECYRLGSNERTLLCLSEFDLPDTSPEEVSVDPSSLQVSNPSWKWKGTVPYIDVTLKNNSGAALSKVGLKIEYHKEGQDCASPVLDSESYIYDTFIGAGDTKIIQMFPQSTLANGKISFCISPTGGK